MDIDDLVDARAVAEVLGLKHANSMSTYAKRYRDFPRPAHVLAKLVVRDRVQAVVFAYESGVVQPGDPG